MSGESGKAGSERSAVTVQDEQLSTAEIKRRIKLLQEDSELQKLHMQFVIGSVLTEAEFWATRKKLRDGDSSSIPKQRVGLKNAILSDVRPSSDGSSSPRISKPEKERSKCATGEGSGGSPSDDSEIKESVHLDFRHQVSLLVQPMLQVLDAAFAHYDADLEERSAKSREIPNGFGEEKAGAAS